MVANKKSKDRVVGITRTTHIETNTLGMPSAEEAEKMGKLIPNYAEKAFSLIEKEHEYQIRISEKNIDNQRTNMLMIHITQLLAIATNFILLIVFIVLSYLLIKQGSKLAGSIFGAASISSVLLSLIYQFYAKHKSKR